MYVKKMVLVHVDEVAKIIKPDDSFIKDKNKSRRYFTENEKNYCADQTRCLGARFLIKKCVFDYLLKEKGYIDHKYCDVEIINNKRGQPMLQLYRGVHECAKKMNINNIFISISHSKNWVAGMVIFSN